MDRKITNEDLASFEEKLKCKCDAQGTGDAKWKRIFILDNGISIGRISLLEGKIYSIKHYKRWHVRELDSGDFIFMNLERFLMGRDFISQLIYDQLLAQAYNLVKADYKAKQDFRKNNPIIQIEGKPKKKRKKLEGKNIRYELQQLVLNY